MHDDNPVIPCVCNDEISHVIDGNSLGAHELAISASLAAKNPSCCSVRVDDKDMMHVEVGDNDVPVVIEGDPSGRVKVSTEVALVAKLAQENAIVTENQKPVVACVGDCNATVDLVHCNVVGVNHLSIISTFGAKHKEESAVEFHDLDSVVVFVGYHNVALSRNCHSSWPVKLAWSHSLGSKYVGEDSI